MTIDAVAFDLDGTLYPRAMMHWLSLPLAARYPRFVYHFSRVRRILRRLARIDNFRGTQAGLVAARLGMDVAGAEALIERIVYREWVDLLRGIRPFPQVRDALASLRGRGLRLGLMSDFPVEEKLGFLGLRGLWDVSLCSEEAGYLKPHERPFRVLAQHLGAPPGRILYVGDSVSYDVRGAASAGMRTALLGRRSASADLSVASYAGFHDLIARRFG